MRIRGWWLSGFIVLTGCAAQGPELAERVAVLEHALAELRAGAAKSPPAQTAADPAPSASPKSSPPPPMGASPLPGWILSGSDRNAYRLARDTTETHGGAASARLESVATPNGFSTVMQIFDPADYRGKRVRFAAFVKTEAASEWVGLWMRIDSSTNGASAFDNMEKRPIRGTTDWARHEVVLDVPLSAKSIRFGMLLTGEGKAWIDDASVDVVDPSVPLTQRTPPPRHPANLSFED